MNKKEFLESFHTMLDDTGDATRDVSWGGSKKEIKELAAQVKDQVHQWAEKNNYTLGAHDKQTKAQIKRKQNHISMVHWAQIGLCMGLYGVFSTIDEI